MACKFNGATHCKRTVEASIRVTEITETLEDGNEQVQYCDETGNMNEVTMKVNVLPPYALTEAGSEEARKGASEGSSAKEKDALPTPSRMIHNTCDFEERGRAEGNKTVRTAEDGPTLNALSTEARSIEHSDEKVVKMSKCDKLTTFSTATRNVVFKPRRTEVTERYIMKTRTFCGLCMSSVIKQHRHASEATNAVILLLIRAFFASMQLENCGNVTGL